MKKLTLFLFCAVGLLVWEAACQESKSKDTDLFKSRAISLSTRLHPNQDIMSTITEKLVLYRKNLFKPTAFTISSAVGSVLHCHIRFANNSFLTKVDGPLQITSLSGTFDQNLHPHIHISVANGNGLTLGGHLPSLQQRKEQQSGQFDCPIFTTLELSMLVHLNIKYQRIIDPQTTFDELYISYKYPMPGDTD